MNESQVVEQAITVQPRSESIAITPIMDLATAKRRLAEFQEFVQSYLVEGEDYGLIPGTPKPTLFQPGAQKLCELYGFAPTFPESRARRVEDWDRTPPLFDYEFTCVLVSKRTGEIVAEGMGSCNSWESRYRWRDRQRKCPSCGKETIIKGKQEYGGGWVCFKKKGGCGAKFEDGAQEIEGQEVGKVENQDIADLKNTVLKMALKRAFIFATLSATRSSGVFTQDLEDNPPQHEHVSAPVASPKPEAKKAPASKPVAEPKPTPVKVESVTVEGSVDHVAPQVNVKTGKKYHLVKISGQAVIVGNSEDAPNREIELLNILQPAKQAGRNVVLTCEKRGGYLIAVSAAFQAQTTPAVYEEGFIPLEGDEADVSSLLMD